MKMSHIKDSATRDIVGAFDKAWKRVAKWEHFTKHGRGLTSVNFDKAWKTVAKCEQWRMHGRGLLSVSNGESMEEGC
jgi:hypothetical protein